MLNDAACPYRQRDLPTVLIAIGDAPDGLGGEFRRGQSERSMDTHYSVNAKVGEHDGCDHDQTKRYGEPRQT